MGRNETLKTIILVVIAAAVAVGAYITQPRRVVLSPDAAEVGKPFFPDLTIEKIKGLDITDFDPKKAESDTFRVEMKQGEWVLPLKHDYPADAKEALSKATVWLTNVNRDVKVTSDKKQHKEFGLLNPQSQAVAEGVGTLFRVLDESKNVIASMIVGKEVEGKTGWRYVREADKDDVYRANVGDYSVSTRFRDWIEKDLLELSDSVRTTSDATQKQREKFKKSLAKITWTDYVLENGKAPAKKTEVINITGGSEFAPEGQIEGIDPVKQETNQDKLRDLVDGLKNMQIMEVLPKPPGLGPDLRLRKSISREEQQKIAMLENYGFFATRDGDVIPEGGEMTIETKEGITYKLRFGVEGVLTESGKIIESKSGEKKDDAKKNEKSDGKKTDEKKKDEKKADDKKEPKAENQEAARFVLIAVSYDESKFPAIPTPAEPKLDATKPGDKAAEEAAKKKLDAEKEFQKMQTESARKKRDESIANAKLRVKELSDRYDNWYYLVSNDTYKKLKVDKATFAKPKEAKKDDKAGSDAKTPPPIPGVEDGAKMTNPNVPAPPKKEESKSPPGKAMPDDKSSKKDSDAKKDAVPKSEPSKKGTESAAKSAKDSPKSEEKKEPPKNNTSKESNPKSEKDFKEKDGSGKTKSP